MVHTKVSGSVDTFSGLCLELLPSTMVRTGMTVLKSLHEFDQPWDALRLHLQ